MLRSIQAGLISADGSACVLLIIDEFNISSGLPFYLCGLGYVIFHLVDFLDFIVLFVALKSQCCCYLNLNDICVAVHMKHFEIYLIVFYLLKYKVLTGLL